MRITLLSLGVCSTTGPNARHAVRVLMQRGARHRACGRWAPVVTGSDTATDARRGHGIGPCPDRVLDRHATSVRQENWFSVATRPVSKATQ